MDEEDSHVRTSMAVQRLDLSPWHAAKADVAAAVLRDPYYNSGVSIERERERERESYGCSSEEEEAGAMLSFTATNLYSCTSHLQLPLASIVDEFKVAVTIRGYSKDTKNYTKT